MIYALYIEQKNHYICSIYKSIKYKNQINNLTMEMNFKLLERKK